MTKYIIALAIAAVLTIGVVFGGPQGSAQAHPQDIQEPYAGFAAAI